MNAILHGQFSLSRADSEQAAGSPIPGDSLILILIHVKEPHATMNELPTSWYQYSLRTAAGLDDARSVVRRWARLEDVHRALRGTETGHGAAALPFRADPDPPQVQSLRPALPPWLRWMPRSESLVRVTFVKLEHTRVPTTT